jgi:predicted esterase
MDIMMQEIKSLTSPKKLFIGGFSQGCCMSILCGLAIKYYIILLYIRETIGGILAFSGYFLPSVEEN